MNLANFFFEAPKDPFVFWALAILAAISAWQPISRIYVFGRDLIYALYKRGIVNPIATFNASAEQQADEICLLGEKQIALLISYGFVSMMAFGQAVLMLVLGITISSFLQMFPSEYNLVFRYFSAIFTGLGYVSAGIWLLDGVYQLRVHRLMRNRLKSK